MGHNNNNNNNCDAVFCIFCLKKTERRRRANSINLLTTKAKCCIGLQRYLNVKLLEDSNLDFHYYYCENCELLLDKISELHERLRLVELELEWKVGRLKDIMTLANRVPSRLSFVTEYYSSKGASSSAMEQGTQEWRASIVRKCRTRLRRSLPKVQMRRLEESSPEPSLSSPSVKTELPQTIPELDDDNESSAPPLEEHSITEVPPTPSNTNHHQTIHQNGASSSSSLTISAIVLATDDTLEDAAFDNKTAVEELGKQFEEPHNNSNSYPKYSNKETDCPQTSSPPPPTPIIIPLKNYYSSISSPAPDDTSTKPFPEMKLLPSEGTVQNEDSPGNPPQPVVACMTSSNGDDDDEPHNKGHLLSMRSSLRAHYRCPTCFNTFSSLEKLELHQASEAHQNVIINNTSSTSSSGSDSEDGEASEMGVDDDVFSSTTSEVESDDESVDGAGDDEVGQEVRTTGNNELLGGATEKRKIISFQQKCEMYKMRMVGKVIGSRGAGKCQKYEAECTICKKGAKTLPNNIGAHYKSHHDVEGMEPSQVVRCDQPDCSAYFRTEPQLASHRKLKHQQQPNSRSLPDQDPGTSLHPHEARLLTKGEDGSCRWCAICRKRFPVAYEYANHHKRYHDLSNVPDPDKVFKCSEPGCSAYFLLAAQLARHLARRHGIDSRNNTRLSRHSCSVCPKWYATAKHLRNHFQKTHDLARLQNPEEDGAHKCGEPNCSAYFLTARQLASHRGSVHDLGVQCETCGKDFRTRKYLRNHRLTMHRDELDLSRFVCTVKGCGKGFEFQVDLQRHAHIHSKSWAASHQEKEERTCPKCGKICRGAGALAQHMRTHYQISHVCEQCGKSFQTRDGLARHCLMHSGPESWGFQCSTCGKKCIIQAKLDEHMRTHTGEKPWVCQHCGVAYAHKHNLRNHVNSKHPEAPDLPRPFDKSNLSSRKGIKRKAAKGGGGGGGGGIGKRKRDTFCSS